MNDIFRYELGCCTKWHLVDGEVPELSPLARDVQLLCTAITDDIQQGLVRESAPQVPQAEVGHIWFTMLVGTGSLRTRIPKSWEARSWGRLVALAAKTEAAEKNMAKVGVHVRRPLVGVFAAERELPTKVSIGPTQYAGSGAADGAISPDANTTVGDRSVAVPPLYYLPVCVLC